MQRHRLKIGIGTGLSLVVVSALIMGLGWAAEVASASTTVVVKPSSLNGWGVLLETGSSGVGDFMAGPASAPLGTGSAHFTTGASADGILIGVAAHLGTKLSDITTLQYSTYQDIGSTSTVQVVSLQFNVDNDVTDGDLGWKGRLVFEPYYSETVVNGSWQTWDALTQGKWWGTHASISSVCSIGSPCTWSAVLTNFPNIGIHVAPLGAVLFKAGSGWPAGFNGNVDAFTIGVSGSDTTYDFEPETPCTTICYVDATTGNDAYGGDTLASAKQTIQAAISQVDVGGTVYVNDGTYNESPNITKSLSLLSINGRDVTTINLQAGPTYLGGLTIDAPIVTVDGFTVVGFDAANPALASSNIVVTTLPDDVVISNNRLKVGLIDLGSNGDDGIGLLTTYNTAGDVANLTVTGNEFVPVGAEASRAFYINPGVNHFTFSQNTISGQFNGRAITQAKDGLVEDNTVTGVGPAGSRSRGIGTWGYPDPSVYGHTIFRKNTITGTNIGIAVYETEQVTIENNFFSDNGVGVWVGDATPLAFDLSTVHVNGNSILNSDTYGVEKSAAIAGVLDASANWWGSDAPGTVAAEASAEVDYTPWLDVSTDTSGDPGFQGNFATLNVDDDSPQTGDEGRIQEGVDLVTASTVNVFPGVYTETATNRFVLGTNGPHQFGLFIDLDGTTVQGVDGGGTPITDYNSVLAQVRTDATNNFGASGIFVEGDDVTITGLEIMDNLSGNNKTIEIIGDNFTLKHSHINVGAAAEDGGSVYFNDWQFDVPNDESHIRKYRIEANWIDHGTSIDLTSGAGYSGPVSGRIIKNNTFTMEGDEYWPFISFNGSGTGVPWFVQSVGGAVIEGNDFTNTFNGDGNPLHDVTAAHIRARGTYDNSQFDWTAYWNDNAFNKATVTLIGAYPPFDVRTYSYTSGGYTFNDVRRIGPRIQPAVNHAQTSDTVLVNEGTYPEQVVITKTLALVGEDGKTLTFIEAPATIPVASNPDSAIVKISDAGVSAEVTGFTITGPGPSGCGSIAFGIFVRDGADAHIHHNNILDVRDAPFSGCQNGVGIQVGRAALSTSGTALIEYNTLAGYQKNGITISNAGSSATIAHNTLTGAGPTTVIAQNGIQVSSGATADINTNTVSDHSYTPFSYVSTGLLLFDNTVNTNDNLISENQVGIYIIEAPGTHDSNVVNASGAGTGSAGFWGIVVDDPPPHRQPSPWEDAPTDAVSQLDVAATAQVVILSNNELDGDGTSAGVGLEADGGFGASDIDLTATNNHIRNWGTGVVIYLCDPNVYTCTSSGFANATFNFNNLTGNVDDGFVNLNAPLTVNGEKNWWGAITGPSGGGPGTGDSVSGDVDFTPWLCDGTDTSGATGFQPNPTTSPCEGTLKVTKVVNWNGATPNPAQTFTICITGPSHPAGDCQTADWDGGVLTWNNLLSGAYTVSEIAPGPAWTVLVSDSPATITTGNTSNATVTNTHIPGCFVYGVQDSGKANTQFFTYDTTTGMYANLGGLQWGKDVEGLDIHPTTGVLYGVTGENNTANKRGYLYKVNKTTGALTQVGFTGFKGGLQALSFRPDGTLWGWAEEKGLVTLNLTTGASTVKYRSGLEAGGLAWNSAGTLLYVATGKKLYVYNPVNGKLTFLASNLPGNTEMLELRPDGLLSVGVHGVTTLYAYDINLLAIVPGKSLITPYNDIEGLAWPTTCAP